MPIELVNVALALVVLFLIAAAIAADWAVVWPKWRPLMVAVAVEQAVLAYRSWTLFQGEEVGGGHPALLLALSFGTLTVAALFALQGRHDKAERPR